ncbi:DUF6338 family protein [Streptomyces phaeochromogenes]|uniref:DUF6338 family protein n=1 Tax=Streptomyces phaeochromogenes TaxID=1923 RepID=UPI00386455D6|nr:DUF6338 family protein [Streptomyces phaeochromogenes]
MPSSAVALFVLLVSAAPGYVYVRIVEVRRPRRRRSSLLELVDLVCVGAVGSAMASLAVLLAAPHWTALLPLEGLLEGSPYLVRHPWQAVWSAVLAFAVSMSCAAAAGLAVVLRGGTETRHTPASPMRRAVDMTPPGQSLWLAVQLTDGRLWEGFLLSMDGERESLGEGDLVLQAPLAVTLPGKGRHHHPARFVALPGSQIVLAYGLYTVPRPRSGVPPQATPPAVSAPPPVLFTPSSQPGPQAPAAPPAPPAPHPEPPR